MPASRLILLLSCKHAKGFACTDSLHEAPWGIDFVQQACSGTVFLQLVCDVGASEAGMGTDHPQVPGSDIGPGQGQPERRLC